MKPKVNGGDGTVRARSASETNDFSSKKKAFSDRDQNKQTNKKNNTKDQ